MSELIVASIAGVAAFVGAFLVKNKNNGKKNLKTKQTGGTNFKLNIYHNIPMLESSNNLGARGAMMMSLMENSYFNCIYLNEREYANNKYIPPTKNNAPSVFIIFFDLYSYNRVRMTEDDLSEFLDKLEMKGTLIPNKNLIKEVGTKKYVISFKDLMLPGTLTYPIDESRIISLKKERYIVKYGMSGANQNNYIIYGTGKDIIGQIERNITNNWIGNPKFAIIQPFSDIFPRCSEYRFLLIDGNIVDFFYGTVGSEPNESKSHLRQNPLNSFFYNYFKSKTEPLIINKKIYEFLKKIVKRIKNKITLGIVPDYLRLDIIIECSENPVGNDQLNILPDIVNPTWNGNVYLNEIENLASGVYGLSTNAQVKDVDNHAFIVDRYNSYRILNDDIFNRLIKLLPKEDGEIVLHEKIMPSKIWNEFLSNQNRYKLHIDNSIKWFEYLKSLNLSNERLVLYNNIVSVNTYEYEFYTIESIVNKFEGIPMNCKLPQNVILNEPLSYTKIIDEIITSYTNLLKIINTINNNELNFNIIKCIYYNFILSLRILDKTLMTFYQYIMQIVNSNENIKTISLPSLGTKKFKIFSGNDFYMYFVQTYYPRFEKVKMDLTQSFEESNESIYKTVDEYHDKELDEYGIEEFNI